MKILMNVFRGLLKFMSMKASVRLSVNEVISTNVETEDFLSLSSATGFSSLYADMNTVFVGADLVSARRGKEKGQDQIDLAQLSCSSLDELCFDEAVNIKLSSFGGDVKFDDQVYSVNVEAINV